MIKVSLPDGKVKEYQPGITVGKVIASLDEDLGRRAVAARLDGRLVDLSAPVTGDNSLEVLTRDTPEALEVLRHSASHIMAAAVKKLFPGVKFGTGPATEEGFYYDFELPRSLTEEDLPRIEREMKRIIAEGGPFERQVVSREAALEKMEELGQDYKVELLEELDDALEISLYQQDDFLDLCVGPHVPSADWVKAFRLLRVAGSYWRGDSSRNMLQRVSGTAFFSPEDLERYLQVLEEAKKRDHRVLGKQLDLYSTHEEVGSGLIHWHPKGAMVRYIIERFWIEEHLKRGYELVYTPHIASEKVYQTSGHLEAFSDMMYAPMDMDGTNYYIRPMNCPGHILIYQTRRRSYRELPIRYAELGTVYRHELSGVSRGLLRVRGFTIDDAHIFCRPDQLVEELVAVVDFADYMLDTFGFAEYEVDLSVRERDGSGPYIGEPAAWQQAEAALQEALKIKGLGYHLAEGEAKFYGPAIDIKVKDALGRLWQGPTIQCDFNEPMRFDINYVASDGSTQRTVMVHRTVLGSMERFFACLIEHYVGAFPLWLAPVQVRVLPISEKQSDYARKVLRELLEVGLRAEADLGSEKIGYKIRQATLEKVPYMLVVGAREEASSTVAVRHRTRGDQGASSLGDFLQKTELEISRRA